MNEQPIDDLGTVETVEASLSAQIPSPGEHSARNGTLREESGRGATTQAPQAESLQLRGQSREGCCRL